MRALVFDLDGTLLEYPREYGTLLADAFREVTGEAREEWLETYNEAFFEYFSAHDPDPVGRAFAALDTDADPDRFAEALLRVEAETCRPPAGAIADLERLADEYRLGVLTNGLPEWQRHKLRENDLAGRFDAVVASYEAGAHKPDTAPFDLLEERLPADRYVMVGDGDGDVGGADAAGWIPHRYEGSGFGNLPEAIDWG